MSPDNLNAFGWIFLWFTITVVIDMIQDLSVRPQDRVGFLDKQSNLGRNKDINKHYWSPMLVSSLITISLYLMSI